jgi:uncharacterized paraquat-inducible protein A
MIIACPAKVYSQQMFSTTSMPAQCTTQAFPAMQVEDDYIVVSQAKHYCEYCHQLSTDDSRGGCIACGTPRQQ